MTGCAVGPTHVAHARQITVAQPTPSTAAPIPSPSPSPTPKPAFKSLAWYVAQVPTFTEAPLPQPVQVPTTGTAAFWHRLPTDQKVAFITIDDGGLARPPEVIDFIWQAHIPVTMFLNSPAAAEHTDYFRRIEAAGGVVENHTINHTSLAGRSYAHQKQEICGAADRLEALFGKRPTLFRPRSANMTAAPCRPHTTAARRRSSTGPRPSTREGALPDPGEGGPGRRRTADALPTGTHGRPSRGAEGDPPGRAHPGTPGGLRTVGSTSPT
ncbi:polysaccharide deacetylase family protein [Micromonospora sp. M12]